VQFFVSKIAGKSNQTPKMISPDAMAALEVYGWPGNIRQLENEIQRAYVMSGKDPEITLAHLSPAVVEHTSSAMRSGVSVDGAGRPLKEILDGVEREMIKQALIRCEGNKSEAARQLGISRSNLIAKAQEYGVE
jgi:two-component system response regulator AtoC